MSSSTDGTDNIVQSGVNFKTSDLTNLEKAWRVIHNYRSDLRREGPVTDGDSDKQERTRKTKQRIIASAQHVFINEGHANLSLRKVADHAGVAVGNLTYHFPTKQALLDATLKEALADYVEEHLDVLSQDKLSPLETLLDIVDFYVRNARKRYRFFFQLWGFAGSSDEARKLVGEIYRPIGRFIYYLICASNPKLNDAQARRALMQISSLEEGYKLFLGIGPDNLTELKSAEDDIRALVTRIVENP